MEAAFGSPAAAEKYSGLADAISDTMRPKYWDARKGMFADTFSRSDFSQHVNVLAILCGVVEGEEASALLHRITDDRTVMPCSAFFRYYLQQAMKLTGNGAMLFDGLRIWRDQLALGLTTWAEQPEPSRSDCHAWSASPNIEFYRIILGIDSTGYRNSKNFGDNWISAGYSLWFLRESRLLNHARDILGTSAAVSGPGSTCRRESPGHLSGGERSIR